MPCIIIAIRFTTILDAGATLPAFMLKQSLGSRQLALTFQRCSSNASLSAARLEWGFQLQQAVECLAFAVPLQINRQP